MNLQNFLGLPQMTLERPPPKTRRNLRMGFEQTQIAFKRFPKNSQTIVNPESPLNDPKRATFVRNASFEVSRHGFSPPYLLPKSERSTTTLRRNIDRLGSHAQSVDARNIEPIESNVLTAALTMS